MDSFTFNKIAGAVLMVLLLTMGLGFVSDNIFKPPIPDDPGYRIVLAAPQDSDSVVEAVPEVVPIGERLLAASVSSGESAARKCAACHAFEKGGANKVGPALYAVLGRKPGGLDDFGYSSAMVAYGDEKGEWTYDGLDNFLANPKQYIDGTSMGFAGIRRPEERADLIAYMREQADDPVPLPAPAAE